jgi:hypothetical protein
MLSGKMAAGLTAAIILLKMVNSVTQLSDPAPTRENAPVPVVMSYLLMRRLVGVIAVLLPLVLVVANWAVGHGFEPSMSGYYYTPMRNIFVGSLWAIGVFLVTYDGYDLPDRLITDIAGLCTICISLFPTTPGYKPTPQQVLIGNFHLGFALVAFVLLAVMAFRFAKTEPTPPGLSFWRRVKYAFGFTGTGISSRPLWATVMYRVCGVVILICIALIYPLANTATYSLLVLEAIMLVTFGISWFVKGSTILTGG